MLETKEHSIRVFLESKGADNWEKEELKDKDSLKVLIVHAGNTIRKKIEKWLTLEPEENLSLLAENH